jgi:hypothetical protein
MQNKPGKKTQPKKTFNWGISSTSIDFMQTSQLQAARDGSASDCGSGVSPVPQPPRKPQTRATGKA